MKKTGTLFGKRTRDMFAFKRILKMKSDNVKSFFNMRGCGLEIEFGVIYQTVSSRYIKTGLEKIKSIVGANGKFVTDITVNHDFNVEIVLNPLSKQDLKPIFDNITEVLYYYENFVHDENCGVHANFLGDYELKKEFYECLVSGGYDSSRFDHNKYKVDLLEIAARTPDSSLMSYDQYLHYQKNISGKYTAVNFLKDNLIEFRALDLNWSDIEYVIDLYESVASPALITA